MPTPKQMPSMQPSRFIDGFITLSAGLALSHVVGGVDNSQFFWLLPRRLSEPLQ